MHIDTMFINYNEKNISLKNVIYLNYQELNKNLN